MAGDDESCSASVLHSNDAVAAVAAGLELLESEVP